MGFLGRLFESRKAREEREEAERLEVIAVFSVCQKCGNSAGSLIPIQIRAVGTESSVDLNVCHNCFEKAANIAVDIR